MRILTYPVEASGWTDELTDLHETHGAGTHFVDKASRRLAVSLLKRCLANSRPTIIEIGVSGGHLLRDLKANCRKPSSSAPIIRSRH